MSEQKTVLRGKVVLAEGVLEDGVVVIAGKRIGYVGPPLAKYQRIERKVASGFIWPGLIDLHVHGAGGYDVMDATPEALETIAQTLVRYGVTGFLATTLTAGKPHLERVLANVAKVAPHLDCGAKLLGIHLEGPWICSRYRGAQNPEYIVEPVAGDAQWAIKKGNGQLRLVTLAPELPGALELIRSFVQRNVLVSIGHTGATYEEAEAGVVAGATQVTHCFNAMSGLHHRHPGVAGMALVNERLRVELIADGFHVHPAVVKLLAKVKGARGLLLISDGMRAVGMPCGKYDLGGLQVMAQDGKATLDDGSLAGSLLTLDQAVRNMVRYADLPLWQAVRMASLTPAEALGMDHETGSLAQGKRADVVVTDEQCYIQQVWVEGRFLWSKPDNDEKIYNWDR